MAPWPARLVSGPAAKSHGDGTARQDSSQAQQQSPGHVLDIPVIHAPSMSPSASQPSQSRRSHSRSFSNPFPSLFGSKRNPSHQNGGLLSFPEFADGTGPHPNSLSRSLSPHKHVSGRSIPPEDSSSRKCMTCGHTNSFPKGRKGFRCGKCNTVNDLEPYQQESSLLQVPADGLEMPAVRRSEGSVSIERTRSIIDQCLTSYLQRQLEGPESSDKRGLSTSGSTVPGSLPSAETSGHAHPIPLRPRAASSVQDRSVSTESRPRSLSNTNAPLGPARQGELTQHVTFEATCNQAGGRRPPEDGEAETSPTHEAMVFVPLERYITMHFDGCDSLNRSFITLRPRHPRTASEGGQSTAFGLNEVSASCAFRDAPLSQLDEKTLRLGDIAENGLWWTGERPTRHKSTDDRMRPRPADSGSGGLVSLKSPRINWAELHEWYRLILTAGESWHDKWTEIKPIGSEDRQSSARLERWNSAKLASLNQKIYESRLHLRVTLLKATEKLLQRPKQPLRRPDDIRFILLLLENPLLHPSGPYSKDTGSPLLSVPRTPGRPKFEDEDGKRSARPQQTQSTAADRTDYRTPILKRALGILSNLSGECHHLLVSWFSRLSEPHFRRLVEVIGSFVTHRLTRQRRRRRARSMNPAESNIDEFVPTYSSTGNTTAAQLHTALHREKSSKPPVSEEPNVLYADDWQIKAAARVVALLFRANYLNHNQGTDLALPGTGSKLAHVHRSYKPLIPISSFYSTMVDYSDLVGDFEAWESRSGRFSFCQYSFFLSIWAKIRILEHDARRQMEAKAREAFFDSILGRVGVSQYLVLKVRRDCLVEDSLRGVSEVIGSAEQEIKKGLRIEFEGEEGVDAGGLRKEWFLLLTREIFDPLHGLFLYDEDSQYCYFNPYCFESSEQFFLVGVLLGLAIYNSTILDLALPPFAFRKLLAASASSSSLPALAAPPQPFRCTLEDLAEYRPALAKGLRQLLDYEGDVESTFCQTFSVHQERYGEAVEVPLCVDGETRAVTNSNRLEFVELYVRYILNESVSRQFEPFKRGFLTVCGGNALYLFRPEEIELLVRGSDEPLDIPSLRAVAVYEHWPVPKPDKEPVVNWFWAFFAALSPDDQRKLLSFITGSDRIPAMGATNLIIRLVCLGQDSERFPIARTCFNMVSLYRYSSRSKLESKLWRAVMESEGFGLK